MATRSLTANERLIARIGTYRCANSTDAGGEASNHYVKDGGCLICDRGIVSLAQLHGLSLGH